MDADGGDQTNLTNNPANAEFAGHFSPDGERVVFGEAHRQQATKSS